MATIMTVSAHPDDAEFAMGASLLKFAQQGHTIVMVVLTRGECGTHGTPEEREKEQLNAADFIGATLEQLDFKDCQIFDTYEARLKIADMVRKHRPDVVFAPYYNNPHYHRDGRAHPDHTATGTLVRNALRIAKFKKITTTHDAHNVKRLIYYMPPRGTMPSLINDVTDFMPAWRELIKKHATQYKGFENIVGRLEEFRKVAGNDIGVTFAEPFIIEEPLPFDDFVFA